MRIEFKTIYCGPDGNHHPGDVVEVSEPVGRLLTMAGYAIEVKAPVETQKATTKEPETATVQPEETATPEVPTIKKRRGRPPKNG